MVEALIAAAAEQRGAHAAALTTTTSRSSPAVTGQTAYRMRRMRKQADVFEPLGADDDSRPCRAERKVDSAVGALTLLADPTRLRMLFVLGGGEHDVGTLAQATGTTPAAASQHRCQTQTGRPRGCATRRQAAVLLQPRGGHVRRLVEEALPPSPTHRVSGCPRDHVPEASNQRAVSAVHAAPVKSGVGPLSPGTTRRCRGPESRQPAIGLSLPSGLAIHRARGAGLRAG